MFDLRHPFFNPLWVRVATTAFAGGWALVEFAGGAPFWGVLFGAIAAWCGWEFFVKWPGPVEDEKKD